MSQIVCFLFLASFFGHAQSIQPGIWKSKSTLNLNSIPLPTSEDEECISGDSAKDIKITIAKELKKKGCNLTKWIIKGKKLNASLECKNDDLEAEGKIHGLVNSKSYDLSGDAKGTYKMFPATASLKLRGQWTKACSR